MKTEQYKVIDLFCGCGGLSLGFQNAGYHIVSAFDWWDVALNIYQKNFNHPAVKRDLSNTDDLSDLEALHPDIIIGGLLARTILLRGTWMKIVVGLHLRFPMRK